MGYSAVNMIPVHQPVFIREETLEGGMSKPNRYRTDKDDDRETEPSRKGHHGLALLILILLAGVVVWFWLARGIRRHGKNSPTVWQT